MVRQPVRPRPSVFPLPSRAPEDCTLTSVATCSDVVVGEKGKHSFLNPQSYDGRWLILLYHMLYQCCMIAMIIISYSRWMDKTPQFVNPKCSMTLGSLAGAQ
jgi:hypothetical protein